MILSKTDSESASLTANLLLEGKIAILPTDTVYGFSGIVDIKGRNPFSTDDVIRSIKGRSETKPLIQLISSPEEIRLYTKDEIPESLSSKWPGALTVICNIKEDSPLSVYSPTVAFRCPGDAWLRKVISLCGAPIYSTSVNRSGFPVLDEEKEIISEFEKDVSLIVSDGDKKNALPSTLVRLEKDGKYTVLRQGSLVV